jgi:hypothetical protein
LLIKKKILNSSYLLFIKSLFTKLLLGLGFIFLVIIISAGTYYSSSGIGNTYSAKSLFIIINNKILDPYLGVNLLKYNKYLDLTKIKIKYFFNKPEIEKLYLKVNQKTILQIEIQRKLKEENDNLLPPQFRSMHPLEIQNKEKKYKAKIRIKGGRPIHWKDKLTSSYKLDLIGDNRLWGMEEFSVQKPITKNYAYEFIFHKLLKKTNNLYLNYFPINLYFNDENRGVYAVEESFSKELLERQKKRNGPIFSLDEGIGEHYPNVNYELYSESYWFKEYPELTKSAFSILNQIKDNDDLNFENHFDIDKWASYFAVIDLLGSYHGSLSKSVRLYFNPISSKFEPIGYDAHVGAGNFLNFILADFLQENRPNCIYICDDKSWYLKFFKLKNGQLNSNFLEKYIYYLELYSSDNFINEFLEEIKDELDTFNLSVYSENSKVDKISRKGLGPYLFDDKIIFDRAKLIKNKINSINFDHFKISLENKKLFFKDNYSDFPVKITTNDCDNSIKQVIYLAGNMTIDWDNGCKKILLGKSNIPYLLTEDFTMSKKKITNISKDFINLATHPGVEKISKNTFRISNNINLDKNFYTEKNQNFIIKDNVIIELSKNSILFVKGDIKFEGTNKKEILVKSDSTGSIIFENNIVEISNTKFENLGYPKLDQYTLFAGLNFIKSNVLLENLILRESKSEDAINLISSDASLKNIYLENIQSDGIDIDFGIVKFNKVYCLKIENDCMDISGADVNGVGLEIDRSLDKGLSIGENSVVKIEEFKVQNSKLAIAVKDGSRSYIKNFYSSNNQYDIALFNKKKEYGVPTLNLTNFTINEKKILQSKKSSLIIDENNILGNETNSYINSILY